MGLTLDVGSFMRRKGRGPDVEVGMSCVGLSVAPRSMGGYYMNTGHGSFGVIRVPIPVVVAVSFSDRKRTSGLVGSIGTLIVNSSNQTFTYNAILQHQIVFEVGRPSGGIAIVPEADVICSTQSKAKRRVFTVCWGEAH